MSDSHKSNKDYDYIFKIVLIGDTCVGKSCILVRFSDDVFVENYVTTIGVDFRFKTMIVKNKIAKIQIWDTAGQERYRSITTAYYRGAAAIIICCDSTNKESFYNINNWIDEISKYTDKDVDKLVLMNKCDLVEDRQIDKNEISKFEKENGIKIMEVSAKTGNGIDKAFEYIIEKLIDKNEKKNNNAMTLQSGTFGNKPGCC
jgi:Ras-related protein Rab-1A